MRLILRAILIGWYFDQWNNYSFFVEKNIGIFNSKWWYIRYFGFLNSKFFQIFPKFGLTLYLYFLYDSFV